MTETIYKKNIPAIELCFDTDRLNVWDGTQVVQFKVTSLGNLINIFDEVLGPDYNDCPIYTTVWGKHFLVKSSNDRPSH